MTPAQRIALIDRIAAEYQLDSAHWGSNGREFGVWGVDSRGLITFVIVTRKEQA